MSDPLTDLRTGDEATDEDTGRTPAGAEPGAPAPLGIERTPTGHPGVDADLARLAGVDHLAADLHTGVYEDVHRGLRDALTALDAHTPAPAPAPRARPSYNRS